MISSGDGRMAAFVCDSPSDTRVPCPVHGKMVRVIAFYIIEKLARHDGLLF
jgi:hypothetical protein